MVTVAPRVEVVGDVVVWRVAWYVDPTYAEQSNREGIFDIEGGGPHTIIINVVGISVLVYL